MNEKSIDIALCATEIYCKYSNSAPEIREAKFLECLYPNCIPPMQESDYFFGDSCWELTIPEVLVDCAPWTRSQIGYQMPFMFARSSNLIEKYPHRKKDIEFLVDFWSKESTFIKLYKEAPENVHHYLFPRGEFFNKDLNRRLSDKHVLGSGIMSGSYDTRIVGLMPEYEKILRLGVSGLKKQVEQLKDKSSNDKDFYEACLICFDIISTTCKEFALQAKELAKKTVGEQKEQLLNCANALKHLAYHPARTLYEAIQMIIVCNILTRTQDHGRYDVLLGDYLQNDIENNILDTEKATQLVVQFWKTLSRLDGMHDARIILGGKGRKNEENADRFALIAMEATLRTHDTKPVLTLRVYKGQNPKLIKKALECIKEGCIYPTLYNDDVIIKGVQESMNIPNEDAENYAPLGCGEFTLSTGCAGSPNSTMRFLKILEVLLHNGKDGADGYQLWKETGDLSLYDTYEKLENSFLKLTEEVLKEDIALHEWNYLRTKKEYSAIMQSIFTADCIERGKSIFNGGIRYFGANTEGFGITNTVNSLAVIKKLVYEDKEYTLKEFVDILDKNFEGYEETRKKALKVPKYGNNIEYVDNIKLRIEQRINDIAKELGRKSFLQYYTIANVNPGGIDIGPAIAASADGRKCGTPMALGNSPTPGTDVDGLSSMLISAAKSSDNENGGYVTNMNISRKTIADNFDKILQMFLTYFELGGQQLNVNCFNKGDLERALENPEQYQNLIVRVSGYSAKFIDLDKITQQEIMKRTLY